MKKEKLVWNILRLTTGSYIYIYDRDNNRFLINFKNKNEAYWALITAINKYNDNIEWYKENTVQQAYDFSFYNLIDYSEFEIIKTKPEEEQNDYV